MTQKRWRAKIREAAKEAGTYRPYFDKVIDTLAAILEQRDKAKAKFEEDGGQLVVEFTNKNGAVNLTQNPMLRMINDLNRDALAYWRDLGLTPAGLKKIDENAMKPKKRNALAEALKELGQ